MKSLNSAAALAALALAAAPCSWAQTNEPAKDPNAARPVKAEEHSTSGSMAASPAYLRAGETSGMTMYEIISRNEKYKTFAEMLKDEATRKSLMGEHKTITLLAPSDEAFAKLTPAERQGILTDAEKRTEYLSMYTLPSGTTMSELGKGPKTTTISKQDLLVTREGDVYLIGNARVVGKETVGKDGTIIWIDSLLAPNMGGNAPGNRQVMSKPDQAPNSGAPGNPGEAPGGAAGSPPAQPKP